MKLTPEQIDRLYQFTRQHYVEWYDLQTELVDHLANAIEQQWQENPKISFEDALQIEFKKFGIFGFMDVVEKRKAALGKKYNLLIWKHFKSFFKIPQIIGVIIATFLTAGILKIIYFDELFTALFIGSFLITLFIIWISKYKKKKQNVPNEKRWLFKEMIYSYGGLSGILYLPFQLLNILFNGSRYNVLESNFWLFTISFILVSFYLSMYIIMKIIPSKAEDYLKETYPEYALENAN